MLIEITSLYINNNSYTDSTIKIVDPYPIVTWDYSLIDRIEISSSSSSLATPLNVMDFEVKIGDSPAGLGSDSFNGNIINLEITDYDLPYWRYREAKLVRGNTYYGQIRITDELNNSSEWKTFEFQYNSLPTVSNYYISPTVPTINDDLELNYTFNDQDGDSERSTEVWWYKNGVHESQFDNLNTIDKENLEYGDIWVAHIYPSDGYELGQTAITSAVTVNKDTPVAQNLSIEPSDPTINDPLFAKYDFVGEDDKSIIKWYVNNSLVTGATTKFVRLDLNVDDEVRFEVKPSDGEKQGTFLASPTYTIGKSKLQITDILINSEPEPLKISNLTPSISWKVYSPNRDFTKILLKIGTSPGSDNVYSVILDVQYSHIVPDNMLKNGIDYYVSIAAKDDNETGEYSISHFRTSGSRWESNVSNSTGWTFEITAKITSVDPPSSSSSSSSSVSSSSSSSSSSVTNINSNYYHGVRLYDGSKFCELRIFLDSIIIISDETKEVLKDFSNFNIITVCGKDDDFYVYVNYELVYDGSNKLTKLTNQKLIEFGAIGESSYTTAEYINVFYTTEGSFLPSESSQYYDLQYNKYYDTDGSIDFISGSPGGNIYCSVSSDKNNNSSTVYKLTDYKKPVKVIPVANNIVKVNRINKDPSNKFTYFCHDLGVTLFENYLLTSFNSNTNFASQRAEESNWTLFNSEDLPVYNSSGLKLDNKNYGGILYYSHFKPGAEWFDKVDNKKGWTASFSLTNNPYVSENNVFINSESPDGCGIYVNDGSYWENIIFYPQEIYFKNTNTRLAYDTTSTKHYTVVGKNNVIKIFAKKPTDNKYSLIGSSKLTSKATLECNSNRPSIDEFNSIAHCVWHDDSSGYQRIYYSSYDKIFDAQWSKPVLIVDQPYGASNPHIHVDLNRTIYVLYESHRNDGTDLAFIVKNNNGWSKPYIINADVKNSFNPKSFSDSSSNLHIIWEDYRNNVAEILHISRNNKTGKWSSVTKISNPLRSSTKPSVDLSGDILYVSWTEKYNNETNIKLKIFDINSDYWTDIFSVSDFGNGDYSDLYADATNNRLHIVWHENKNDSFILYSRIFDLTLYEFPLPSLQLTKNTESARFPKIGCHTTTNGIYVVFEIGGDLGPYEYTTSPATDTFINIIRYNSSLNKWYSSNQNESYNIEVLTSSQRYSRRPNIAKRFRNNSSHIVYESEITSFDEYISNTNDFTNIYDVVYDLSTSVIYSAIDSEKDKKISAQYPRREIRFGNFSNYRNSSLTFGYFKYYLEDAVEPFNITYLPFDALVQDASPNQIGDAWLATDDSLLFYLYNKQQLAQIKEEINKPIRVKFDNNNYIYILNNTENSEIFYSEDYVTFFTYFTGTNIIDFDFDTQGKMWVITPTHAIQYKVSDKTVLQQFPISDLVNLNNFPLAELRRIYIDNNNIAWIASSAGLISIQNSTVNTYNTLNSSLSSDLITDISIKNSGTRFISTSNGVYKMIGASLERINVIDTEWSENITAVCYVEPNILYASGYSQIYQILFDKSDNIISVTNYTAKNFANYNNSDECQDFTDYNFEIDSSIDQNALLEVYINGRLIKNGFTIGKNRLRLDSSLKSSDLIEILARQDIVKYSTLEQNEAEVNALGTIERRFKKFIVDQNESIAGFTIGDKKQFVYYNNTLDFNLPYDSIVFDNVAPTGYLVFEKQINSRLIQLFFDEVKDNISGVVEMKVSNWPNLTSNGIAELEWEPFQERFPFDIGTDLGNVFSLINFSGEKGSRIHNYKNYVLAGTSNKAAIYLLDTTLPDDDNVSNVTSATFTKVFDFEGEPDNTSVEFFVNYLGSVVVGTGCPDGQAKVWISSDGKTYKLLQVLSGTHATCGTVLDGAVYIGTKGGPLYKYNNQRVDSTGVTLGSGIFSIYGANHFLWCGTGNQGKIYKINTDLNSANNQNAFTPTFLHAENDSVIGAIAAVNLPAVTASTSQPPDDFIVFAAGKNNGRLIKSINRNAFGPSLVTVPVDISTIKLTSDDIVHACVGKNVYKYTEQRSWKPLYTNTENTHDVAFDQKGIWIISDNYVKRILFENARKRIYFALRDAAGNSSRDPDYPTAIADFEEINIDDLRQFVNENRIVELDEYGSEVFRYTGTGDSSFYSANKVETERAEYYSEIFNGTTDHISWDIIYWDAVVPDDTDLKILVRSGSNRDELLAADFVKTFNKESFEGGDISTLSGQYLQFKVVMTTEVRGKSPKLYKINVKSRTRTSVHFFTTNFILPSSMIQGILTATAMLPVSADIVFGIDTNDSIDFSTYQEIELDKTFTLNNSQKGKNLRVGVKLISPLKVNGTTDEPVEYNEYSEGVYNNLIEFNYTPSQSGIFNFAVQLYSDPELTDLVTTLYSNTNNEAWSINNSQYSSSGETLISGRSYKVICGVKGHAAIKCGTFYYVKAYVSYNSGDLQSFIDDFSYISNCNPNFSDTIEFVHINDLANNNYHYRIKFYSDVTRTDLVKTYYSGQDQTGWIVNGTIIPSSGFNLTFGDIAAITFIPTPNDLEDGTYYLSIDAFDGTDFINLYNSYYMKIVNDSEFSCGEYQNVPIVKDIAIMFELDEFLEKFGSKEKTKKTVTLNINGS